VSASLTHVKGRPISEITRILSAIEHGDSHAAEQLLPLVYDELRKLAAQRLAEEKPGQMLQATALVHEAYVRLVDVDEARSWNSRGHFFAAAAEAMRRILLNQARDKKRLKRGGDWKLVNLEHLVVADHADDDELIALDDALERLTLVNKPGAELIKLRFFVGLTQSEAAAAMGLPQRTAARHWAYARAWLYETLRPQDSSDEEENK
jgi:RNA polymerase sigma factor (TIGR02999 family)